MIIAISVTLVVDNNIISGQNKAIEKQRNIIVKQRSKINNLENKVATLRENIQKKYKYTGVTVTAYSPSHEETDSTPNQTAIMEKPVIGYTCAVSRDLNHLLGKRIYIAGIGVFKVNDVMNKRYTKRVDICLNKGSAIDFGIKKNKTIVLIDDKDIR